MTRRCTNCGKDQLSPYWTFKNSGYCSYRCYAVNSAGSLLLYSSIFMAIFIGSMVGMSFAKDLNNALYIPFIVAMSLGPIPGYVTAILGYIYRKQDKKNPPPTYEYTEEEIQEIIATCSICNKSIISEEKYCKFEPCGHSIHDKHLASWISDNRQCPECGETISKIVLL